MTVVEFLFIQMEMLKSRHPLSTVPGIGEQDASHIPEYGLNGQEITSGQQRSRFNITGSALLSGTTGESYIPVLRVDACGRENEKACSSAGPISQNFPCLQSNLGPKQPGYPSNPANTTP